MKKLTLYERETIVNFNRGEDSANIYTHDKGWISFLSQHVQPDRTFSSGGAEFTVPKSWIRMPRPPRKASDKQKQALANARALRGGTEQ